MLHYFLFQPPQRPLKWEGVRDASRYGAQCLQLEMLLGLILGDEDCLFLNVMVSQKLIYFFLNERIQMSILHIASQNNLQSKTIHIFQIQKKRGT